ncbi:hypothetical protein N7512_004776 [Penicillium capsulatum]|nr:hypothetical protein N7512_004776 [Penicillium capsulatum]
MVCRACPDRYYQPGSNNRWIYLGNYSRVRDESLSSVISAENTLRGAAQRAEALEKGLRVLQKVQDTPEDEQKLQRYTEELKEIPKTYCARQQDLHEQVSLLPRDLREAWGIGHCTVDCWCCMNDRQFEYSARERDQIALRFQKALEGTNPAYLPTLTEAFFTKPGKLKQKAKEAPPTDSEKKPPVKQSGWTGFFKRRR